MICKHCFQAFNCINFFYHVFMLKIVSNSSFRLLKICSILIFHLLRSHLRPSYKEKMCYKMSLRKVGSEILTNITLVLKEGFYHLNSSLKFYAWIINQFKIP